MVECKQCQDAIEIEEAEPDIDEEGFFFVCPACQHRNVLMTLEIPGQMPIIVQFDS